MKLAAASAMPPPGPGVASGPRAAASLLQDIGFEQHLSSDGPATPSRKPGDASSAAPAEPTAAARPGAADAAPTEQQMPDSMPRQAAGERQAAPSAHRREPAAHLAAPAVEADSDSDSESVAGAEDRSLPATPMTDPPGLALLAPVDSAPPPADSAGASPPTGAAVSGLMVQLLSAAVSTTSTDVARPVDTGGSDGVSVSRADASAGLAAFMRLSPGASLEGAAMPSSSLVPAAGVDAGLFASAGASSGDASPTALLPGSVPSALPVPAPLLGQPAPLQAPPLPASTMPAPPPGQWAEPLAERVVWMLDDHADGPGTPGLRQARIDLHPAEWGAMQIRVELGPNGHARVSFDVETPQARAAIESSLSQLRDLLGSSSAQAGSARFELNGGGSQSPRRPLPPVSASARGADAEIDTRVVTLLPRSRGLIDQFA